MSQRITKRMVPGRTAPALCLIASLVGSAGAADSFKRLSAREIEARLSGHVVTDVAHWSDSFLPDGTLKGLELGQLRHGTWAVKDRELCPTRKTREQALTECFEVWQSKDQIEYRRDGITIMEGVLRRQ